MGGSTLGRAPASWGQSCDQAETGLALPEVTFSFSCAETSRTALAYAALRGPDVEGASQALMS